CISCGAFHWVAERTHLLTTSSPQFTSCCLNGQVELPPFGLLPKFLRDLLCRADLRSLRFYTNLYSYNSMFTFTSLDCTPINRGVTSGVQVFQIHGTLYHV
ncbi:hypothetical protein K469DRAFT_492876, partial [Zopfia rhizophila CBS 207.26]